MASTTHCLRHSPDRVRDDAHLRLDARVAGNSIEPGRGVTSKATALLDAYLPRSTELSLGELARRSGLPVSTTYRLATQLVDWGGLERCEGGGYRLGLRIWELGMLARQARSPVDVITPYMQDLYDVVHERVQLAVLDDDEVMYLEKLAGKGSAMGAIRGNRLPVHATSVGKVLLAWADPARLESLLPEQLTSYTPRTITNRETLIAELADIRRTGVGYSREELTPQVSSVAAPIRDASGEVVAALSVTMRTSRLRRHHTSIVMTTATSASRELRGLAGARG